MFFFFYCSDFIIYFYDNEISLSFKRKTTNFLVFLSHEVFSSETLGFFFPRSFSYGTRNIFKSWENLFEKICKDGFFFFFPSHFSNFIYLLFYKKYAKSLKQTLIGYFLDAIDSCWASLQGHLF